MTATPTDTLAAAYHRSLALRWAATVLALPVLVPLLLARGLDLTQVALVMATFAAVTAILEIPTGGLADAFGRVRVTLVADALSLLARLAFMLAPGLGGFLAAAALAGTARALGSGALEAWYVDARRARDPQGDLQGPLARAGMIQSLVLAGGTLAGGALPLAAPFLGNAAAGDVRALQLAYAASAALYILSLAATSRLQEGRPSTRAAKHAAHRSARPDRVARTAIGALARDPKLVLLLTIGAVLGGVVMSFESFLPAELRTRWGAEGVSTVLGAAMAAAFGASAAGQALASRFATTAPRAPLAGVGRGACVIAAGAGLVALDSGGILGTHASAAVATAVAAAGAWFAYLGLGLTTPVLSAAFHARVASGERATMLSVQSLAAYAGGVAATLVLGFVAQASGLATVWLAVAAGAGGAAITAFAWRDRHAWHSTADALRHSD